MKLISKQQLTIEGAYNIRDIGGYQTTNGQYVKKGLLFRSGDLNLLTNEDLSYLNRLNLQTIIDFRSDKERKEAPDKVPQIITESVWLPINAGNMEDIFSIDPKDIPVVMEKVYRYIVSDCQKELREFFRLVAIKEKSPLLFHCSAGKDRTGIAAALLLAALGVSQEIILEDYLLSAQLLKGKYDFIIKKYPELTPLSTVKPNYLEAAFQTINEDFSGTNHYLTKYLQVNIHRLQELYTEK